MKMKCNPLKAPPAAPSSDDDEIETSVEEEEEEEGRGSAACSSGFTGGEIGNEAAEWSDTKVDEYEKSEEC